MHESFTHVFTTDPVVTFGTILLLGGWTVIGTACYLYIRYSLMGLALFLLTLYCGPVAWVLGLMGWAGDQVARLRERPVLEAGSTVADRLLNRP